ncbi:hypothetical protein PMAYCL1PPCAC_26853, partial [Pristionchus mayeri]
LSPTQFPIDPHSMGRSFLESHMHTGMPQEEALSIIKQFMEKIAGNTIYNDEEFMCTITQGFETMANIFNEPNNPSCQQIQHSLESLEEALRSQQLLGNQSVRELRLYLIQSIFMIVNRLIAEKKELHRKINELEWEDQDFCEQWSINASDM